MRDWTQIRREFPILDQTVQGAPLIYFDNAATSQKPTPVMAALAHYYQHDNANVHRGLHELSARATDAYEDARAKLAKFIGANSPTEIVFTRGTTESINLVVHGWAAHHLNSGDAILLTEMEHHSNIVPWQLLAQTKQLELRFVPLLDDGTLDMDAFDRLLDTRVKLVACVHISNSLGTINPVNEICRKAREIGALSLIDGAQSAGHIPVNVAGIGCDFFAFSGHKMCGPTGIGALFGRPEILESMPPWQGGGEMISRVTLEGSQFKLPPYRFEAGTPNIAGAIGWGAAVDYLNQIGIDAIDTRASELTTHALARLPEVPGVRILGPLSSRGSLVSFALDVAHPHDLVEFANSRGLALRGGHHCTQPVMRRFKVPGTARASFAFYNTLEEIDAMIDILLDARKFFG